MGMVPKIIKEERCKFEGQVNDLTNPQKDFLAQLNHSQTQIEDLRKERDDLLAKAGDSTQQVQVLTMR